MNKASWIVGVVALAVVGCGSDKTLADRAQEAAEAYCALMLDCGCTHEPAKDECVFNHKEQFIDNYSGLSPTQDLDEQAFKDCMAEMKAAQTTCAPLPANGPCADMFVGVMLQAEHCGNASDCAAGLDCANDSDTCQPFASVEQSCDHVSCQDGLFCKYDTNVCTAYVQQGGSCTNYMQCAAGLACRWTDNTCAALHALGEDCSDGVSCDPTTSYCDYVAGADTCVARKADGIACGAGAECLSGYCSYASGNCYTPSICP